MDKDKRELEEFMGSLAVNNDPLENKEEDPFGHLETTPEEVVEESKEEKPVPFNKDPKVQKFIEKEISKRMADFKPEPTEKKETVDDDYYVRLIGNDTPEKVAMIKEAMARDERMLQQAEDRAFNKLSQSQREEIEADKEAEQELETAFENIEESFGVDFSTTLGKKTRQEFASFVEKIAPKDRNGDIVDYPDMNSAWETFSELKKSTAPSSRAKELASRSMQRSAETSSEPVLKRGRTPFSNSDDFIESLSK